jgi:hypothetical protein
MKSIKIMGLCLVAAFVMSAVAVSSAFATTITFLFPNGGGAKPNFSSKTGAGTLFSKSGAEVKCTSATNTGSVEPGTDRARSVLIAFAGCTSKILTTTYTCGPGGVIKTFQLEGQLGLFTNSSSESRVGLVQKAEVNATSNPKTLFAEFSCTHSTETIEIKVKGKERGTTKELGGIIAEVLPESVETLLDKGEPGFLTYTNNATNKYIQIPTSLTVLGTTVTELLLESSISNVNGGAFELSAIHENENVELFFLESMKISV